MNKYIFLIILFVTMLGFTSCSGNSLLGSESAKNSDEQEFVTVTSEEEKNTETFLNEIMTETAVSSDNAEDNMTDNTDDGANITEKSDINTTTTTSISIVTYETMTESVNTETNLYDDSVESSTGYFNNITYKFTAAPSAADVNDYADKEMAAMFAYSVNRQEIYNEYKDYHSVLIIYTDGTCAAAIFKSKNGFFSFLDNLDPVFDYEKVCFDIIGSLDLDVSEQLNECLSLIGIDSEYISNYVDEEKPAVVEDCYTDLLVFYVSINDKVYLMSLYDAYPMKKVEDVEPYIELDDNYAKESRDFLINFGIVDYWLENYAWKIGE